MVLEVVEPLTDFGVDRGQYFDLDGVQYATEARGGGSVVGRWTGGRVDAWTHGRVDAWTGGRVGEVNI